MRRKQAKIKTGRRKVAGEPMAEGLVQVDSFGRQRWALMSDEEIIAYAKARIERLGTGRKVKLYRADRSLYGILAKRGLFARVGLENIRRNWSAMDDDGLVSHANDFIRENGITGRGRLWSADQAMCRALMKRGIFERICIESTVRNWSEFTDEELVEHAKKFVREKGIRHKHELRKLDRGLQGALSKRKLMDRIGFKDALNYWKHMGESELLAFTKDYIESEGIINQKSLRRANNALYMALRTRKLLRSIDFDSTRESWIGKSDGEIVALALECKREEGIESRTDFAKMNPKLYSVLCQRKLLDRIWFKSDERAWRRYNDDELVVYAKRFMKERGIGKRTELNQEDSGLYGALWSRRLLDRVGFQDKRRDWEGMGDDELVAYAAGFMENEDIGSRVELQKADRGLYHALWKRGLLDESFRDIGGLSERRAVREVVRALSEF